MARQDVDVVASDGLAASERDERITVRRYEQGDCDPWLMSESGRKHRAVVYGFVRDGHDVFEVRLRCWRHRPDWARGVKKPA